MGCVNTAARKRTRHYNRNEEAYLRVPTSQTSFARWTVTSGMVCIPSACCFAMSNGRSSASSWRGLLAEAASLYRNFYAQYATLARFHAELNIPLPSRFQMAVDFTLNEDLLAALAADEPNAAEVQALLEQVRQTGIPLDTVTLEFAFRRTVERAARHFEVDPLDSQRLRRFSRVVGVCPALPFSTNLWAAQNIYHRTRQAHQSRAAKDAALDVQSWRAALNVLGNRLGFEGELVHAESLAAAE